MNDKVSTGSQTIDSLLCGGFEKGIISTLFGPPGSGKSNLVIMMTLAVANQGKKVIFVDTEGGFSTERASQLDKNYKQLLKNILILNPTTFEEQKKIFSKLRDAVNGEKVGLIVVDSIAMLYRLQKGSDEEIKTTNKDMANQLAILSEIARKKNLAVLVTNQVYADFKNKNNVHMVGGDLLKYWSKCIIKLDIIDGIRKASVFKHRSIPESKTAYFEIVETGLKEAQEPKKRFSLFP
jgi:DNA repair protein RadB